MMSANLLPSSHQRAYGEAEICLRDGRLERFYQRGCMKMLRPKRQSTEAVLINTSGGLTSGDQIDVSAKLSGASSLQLTTQAAERVYRCDDIYANVRNKIEICGESDCSWLPQETILYNGAKLRRDLRVDITDGGSFLGLETFMFGRHAMGEEICEIDISDKRQINFDGKPSYLENLRITHQDQLHSPFGFDNAKAVATIVYVSADASFRIDEARKALEDVTSIAVASAWDKNLVVRMKGDNARILRHDIIWFLRNFTKRALPQVWRL